MAPKGVFLSSDGPWN
uniref:Uncharacterized protein n=1 Tax=Arundo donax TaxID=35708 RepID=A0A0A8Y2L9_ARUDO